MLFVEDHFVFGATVGARPLGDVIVASLLCALHCLPIPRTSVGAEPLHSPSDMLAVELILQTGLA